MNQGVVFVQSESEPAYFRQIKQSISNAKGIELYDVGNLAEASTVVQSGFFGVVMLSASSKGELASVLQFCASLTAFTQKKKTLRILAVNQIPNPKINVTLLGLGCAEVLDARVTAKAVLYKLQRHLKLVRSVDSLGKEPEAKKILGQSRGQGDSAADKSALDKLLSSVRIVDPLSIAEDYWLTRPTPEAKQIAGRWMLDMIGPGPSAGEWVSMPPGSLNLSNLSNLSNLMKSEEKWLSPYEWRPRDKKSPFMIAEGRWIFFGRHVEFVWRMSRWRFVGEKISLFFERGGEVKARRFFMESGSVLAISANSPAALERLEEIEDTFSGDMRLNEGEGREIQADLTSDLLLTQDEEATGDLDFVSEAEPALDRPASLVESVGGRSALSYSGADGTGAAPCLAQEAAHADLGHSHSANAEEEADASGLDQEGLLPEIGPEVKFKTGADAFHPVGVLAHFMGARAEILSGDPSELTLWVESGAYKLKEQGTLEIVTQNLSPPFAMSLPGEILEIEEDPLMQGARVVLAIDGHGWESWTKIQDSVSSRQNEILSFLRAVKGI